MESGHIRDYQLTASSFSWPPGGIHASPYRARLNSVTDSEGYGGWSPHNTASTTDWMQVSYSHHEPGTSMIPTLINTIENKSNTGKWIHN